MLPPRTFLLLIGLFFLIPTAYTQTNTDLARSYFDEQAVTLGLVITDIAEYQLTDHHESKRSKVAHYYFQQQYNGIFIHNAIGSVHILPDGTLLKTNSRFEKRLLDRIETSTPTLTSEEAILRVVAEHNYQMSNSKLDIVRPQEGTDRSIVYKNTAISSEDIPVRLMYQPVSSGKIRLAWDLSIREPSGQNWWSIRVDAETGEVLDKINWVVSCSWEAPSTHTHAHPHPHTHESTTDEIVTEWCVDGAYPTAEKAMLVGTYNVYPYPIESPNHGNRSLVSDPEDLTASPFGWHDTDGVAGAEFTITRGNNVHAYEDGDNQGFSPDGGSGLVFDFPINTTYSTANQSEEAAITNLFYWNNIFHDMWYQYGFDEASGNFQENNYGKGGIGGDYVNAEAQDGSGTCNANFATPPDGNNPTMQMYICGDRDGDLDNGVIAHEYGHGFSIRLTGGASQSGCLSNNEQMGEGWSDWFGLMMTIEASDTGTDSRGMGTWLLGQGSGGDGIRTHPYSTDMAVNPHTYNDISTESVPHGVGSVWCAMLWEMTWALIDEYGFDPDFYTGTGGNNIAMALVTEGMKLQPCSPGFVDGRDAILAADQALYGGANQCLIWEAFAKRGLGISASQGNSGSVSDGTEDFDTQLLEMEKTVDVTLGSTGDVLTYTLTVTNPPLCNTTYNNVVISDIIPNHTTYVTNSATNGGAETGGTVTFPAFDMLPGETASRSFSVEIAPSAPTARYDIFDDMESGASLWTETAVGPSNWVLTTNNPNSGSNVWFAQDVNTNSLQYLQLAEGFVPNTDTELSFWHSYNTEATWDGGLVQISTDGGVSWQDLGPYFTQNGYNSTINNSAASPAFSGNSGGYIESKISLSSFAMQAVSIRFLMYCDVTVGGEGWYIDDVNINALSNYIPNTATLTADGGVSVSSSLMFPTVLVGVTCNDGILNGDETGIDCGGTGCPTCPSCTDGIQNGDETGIDCGGTQCADCPTEDCSTYDFTGAVVSYDAGGSDQGTATVQDAGITVLIENNGWKAVPINYTVTPNTVLDFDFKSTTEGEIHEISFDNNLTAEPTHRYVVYGNQGYSGDYSIQTYSGGGAWQNFVIEIGQNFTGTFDYLVLTADDDASATGNSYFRNVRIYEDYNANMICDAPACETGYDVSAPISTDTTYHAADYITANGTIQAGSNVIFRAGNYIDLNADFEVEAGAEFLAEIEDCTPAAASSTNNQARQEKTMPPLFYDANAKTLFVRWLQSTQHKQLRVIIRDIFGAEVATQKLTSNHIELQQGVSLIDGLPDGVYLAELRALETNTLLTSQKIVLNHP